MSSEKIKILYAVINFIFSYCLASNPLIYKKISFKPAGLCFSLAIKLSLLLSLFELVIVIVILLVIVMRMRMRIDLPEKSYLSTFLTPSHTDTENVPYAFTY